MDLITKSLDKSVIESEEIASAAEHLNHLTHNLNNELNKFRTK